MMESVQPVILCGGSGTRLWPLSRSLYPKQFMDLGGHTLFGDTIARARALPDAAAPLVVCNEEQRFLAAAVLQEYGAQARIVLEPVGRNTAPAIALAAFAARADTADPFLLVLPSDHAIEPLPAFAEAVAKALQCAEDGWLVTFGISPTKPETGYGYIKQGKALASGFSVDRFVEKPDQDTAANMLGGDYFWNSGMFLFRASRYLEELALHAPEIHVRCKAAWESRSEDQDFLRAGREEFASSPADSIDYAVMERTDKAAVIPLSAHWSDLGSWEAFHAIAAKDDTGNALIGDVLVQDAHDCYLHSSGRLVAALGVSDIVLVETADAVLVADRAQSQHIRKLVEHLRKAGRSEQDTHRRVHRPWGSYEVLVTGERFQAKRIVVKPGAQLSLQLHHHRAEHWVVVSGTARVTVGEEVRILHEDQSTYIPLGTVHRLENPGRIPLAIVEIQTGSYLGEDDIVRLGDTYGRAPA